MLLSEAKEILKKNGYRLVKEVYDAVRDHQLTKKNGWRTYADTYQLKKNISEFLNSKKIFNKMEKKTVDTDNFVEEKRGEEIFKVVKFEKHPDIFLVVDAFEDFAEVGQNRESWKDPETGEKLPISVTINARGSESDEFADTIFYNDHVNLYLISEEQNRQTVLDTEKFDARNLPGMVSWIIKTLKNF